MPPLPGGRVDEVAVYRGDQDRASALRGFMTTTATFHGALERNSVKDLAGSRSLVAATPRRESKETLQEPSLASVQLP